MKETPFTDIHTRLGAKMVDFAGFRMPVEYTGIKNEHMAVRTKVGVFDVSHMGEIWVRGRFALDFIQYVTSNDASKLKPGQIQYSCFPNGKGGIVDDLLVYCFSNESYLLVVNASNTEKDYNWLVSNNRLGAELENVSEQIAQLAIQGPKAIDTLQKLTKVNLHSVPYYQFVNGTFAGIDDVIISATGYTGAGGFELYFENQYAEQIWDSIFDAGKEFEIQAAGLGARDTLRLEMGYCLYGNDIDDTTSPLEAGLGWITKFVDNKPFIDREYLFDQKQKGTKRKLKGFAMEEKGIPRHGYEIVNQNDKTIGQVTSGSISPVLNQGIGMGYIDASEIPADNVVYIKIRNKNIKANLIKMPFI